MKSNWINRLRDVSLGNFPPPSYKYTPGIGSRYAPPAKPCLDDFDDTKRQIQALKADIRKV